MHFTLKYPSSFTSGGTSPRSQSLCSMPNNLVLSLRAQWLHFMAAIPTSPLPTPSPMPTSPPMPPLSSMPIALPCPAPVQPFLPLLSSPLPMPALHLSNLGLIHTAISFNKLWISLPTKEDENLRLWITRFPEEGIWVFPYFEY